MTNSFKLLAIRPLKDCDKSFLKNLKAGEIYKLYNDFEFSLDKDNDDVISIKNNSTIPDNLFGENISVSAIVGKNGSGKSTIIELFSSLIFNLSIKLDLINIINFKKNHELSIEDSKRIDNEVLYFDKFQCEIYYIIENSIYSISKKGKFIFLNIFEKLTDNLVYELSTAKSFNISERLPEEEKIKFLRQSFFYSIGANYSLYGLNTTESGVWLKSIFHKNDGYQTPIVLNPMRTDGIIDINRLTYLSKSRLLSNIFRKLEDNQKEEDSLRNLVNNKIVNKLVLKLDFSKFTIVQIDQLKPNQYANHLISINEKNIYLENTEKYKSTHFLLLLKSFYPDIKVESLILNKNHIQKLTIEYILKKVYEIFGKYSQFKGFRGRVFRSNFVEKNVVDCFNQLANDFSHSTFKVRQALNFLVYNFYEFENGIDKEYLLSTENNKGISDIINLKRDLFLKNELDKLNKNFKKEPDVIDLNDNQTYIYNKHNIINYLPPSFFEIDFEFKENGLFKDLSSGEKQMVYSINSIIYHLINLNSIDSENRVTYKYFNIFLDEIELYFHPEFQRKYLYELLKSLNAMNFSIDGINILFLTHSPFILSDIPSQNILKLDEGKIRDDAASENTFGANIHDLLANDFFLKDGFMGEFAKSEINNVISFLANEKNENELTKIDDQIDSLNFKLKKEDLENPKIIEIELIRKELIKTKRKKLLKRIEFNNLNDKYNSEYCSNLIDIIGEPILYNSLIELYSEAYPSAKENFIKQQIKRLQKLIKK